MYFHRRISVTKSQFEGLEVRHSLHIEVQLTESVFQGLKGCYCGFRQNLVYHHRKFTFMCAYIDDSVDIEARQPDKLVCLRRLKLFGVCRIDRSSNNIQSQRVERSLD